MLCNVPRLQKQMTPIFQGKNITKHEDEELIYEIFYKNSICYYNKMRAHENENVIVY